MPGRKPSWTDEQFAAAVAQSFSVAGACGALGLLPLGGNYRTVYHAIDRLALDARHWTGQAWNRGLRLGKSPRRRPTAEFLRAGRPVSSQTLRSRLLEDGLLPLVCVSCGLAEWMGRPIPLEVDHINGDAADNRLENLRLLCPNCHAGTATYRGRNKGRRRRAALPRALR